jgi:RimJ/RimL family protein N-acetyltransferase
VTEIEVPILESERLRLEPLSHAHSEGMFELWSDPGVCEYSGSAIDSDGRPIGLPARSRIESDRLLEYWLGRSRAGTGFRWAVMQGERGEFAGAVGFNSLVPCPEYAYHLVPRFWRHGIGTEASRCAIAWAYSQGAASIESFIEPDNSASIRLALRLGFARPADNSATPVLRFVLARDDMTGRP